MQMEDYLYQKDLYLTLSGKTKKPTGMTDTKWDILDRKALGTIWLCPAALVAFNISKEMTKEQLMSALAKLYEKPQPKISAILNEEMRWKSSNKTLGNALTAETRVRKMERGKSSGYCSKSRKGRSKSRSGIVCWKCGKKGHQKKACKSRKGKEGDM
eukprot:PITA_20567